MADISKIVVPSGDEYDIKDSTSRSGLADKMDKTNPTGTGSFSLNRKANTTIGTNSFAEGKDTTASGNYSHSEGYNTTASGSFSHTEGKDTTASGYSHAEGYNTTASGSYSHAEGSGTTANGNCSHAEGQHTTASDHSHAEGYSTTASGYSHAEGHTTTASGAISHVEGSGTTANHRSQHVFGEYNVLDDSTAHANARGNYVEIVGNGTNGSSRSNARTLDWSGNEVLSGTIEATGFGTTLDKEVDRGGVQLTQAQYDALVNAGTVDANTTYFITDANNTTASYAAGVTYDNTSSGLSATNVQDAIDEVSGDFVDNVCKGRTTARLTEITSSSVINITRTATLQTYLVVVRGTNAGSTYIGLISGYNGGSSRNTIVELSKGNHIGTVSFLTTDVNDLTLSISMASSSISASLNVLVVPFYNDDTFTITKT